MQNRIARKHPATITAIVVLLSLQTILGLFFSLSLLARLLAPGSPIIIGGSAIFAGPVGGASLVVALASPIIAWELWMVKSRAGSRIILLEIMSLGIGAFELVFERAKLDFTLGVCLILIGVAVLILTLLVLGFRYTYPSRA